MTVAMSERPRVGDSVRWEKPGPVILSVERVGYYDWPCDAWWVQAGGVEIMVRADPEMETRWVRLAAHSEEGKQ